MLLINRNETKHVKNNAGKKEQRFPVILTPLSSWKCLLIDCRKNFFWLTISIILYEIRKSQAESFARIESDWTFREGVSFLNSNILCTKLVIALLKDRELFVKIFRDRRVFIPIMFANGGRHFCVHPRADASVYNLHNLHYTSHIEIA